MKRHPSSFRVPPLRMLTILFVLAVVLTVPVSQVPAVYAKELTTEEQALSFLEDVVMLDLEKYNVTVRTGFENYSTYWGVLPLGGARCDLESENSKLRAGFRYENYTLTYFHLYVNEGSPLFTQPPSANFLERADAFLGRYQDYLGTSDCQELRNILSTVTEEENLTTTVGNVRFELTTYLSSAELRWDITVNGADYTKLSFTFLSNGEFAFSDTRHLYEIGSTDLNISREEAISIAREQLANLSLSYTVVDEPVGTALYTMCREPLVLYPYWSVSLYFDRVYPGNVIGFTFEIWAETGEIINGRLNTLLGGFPPEDSANPTTPNTPSLMPSEVPQGQSLDQTEAPNNSPPDNELPTEGTPTNQPPPESDTSSPLNTYLIAGAAASLAAISAISLLVYFKKRKHQPIPSPTTPNNN